ncbi:MAG TPA: hypothetical protein VEK08_16950 [Planctomycetota bacterium]|nr:hypothetical protein [Planctomycetota bacterium]
MSPPDSTPKQRLWFQIHLSTAIILMLVAGVLMLLNFTWSMGLGNSHATSYYFGWPYLNVYEVRNAEGLNDTWFFLPHCERHWSVGLTFLNAAIVMGLLGFFAIILEFVSRRNIKWYSLKPPSMIVAAVAIILLVCVNSYPEKSKRPINKPGMGSYDESMRADFCRLGWPKTYYWYYDPPHPSLYAGWTPPRNIIYDLISAISILVASIVPCEWICRRRIGAVTYNAGAAVRN